MKWKKQKNKCLTFCNCKTAAVAALKKYLPLIALLLLLGCANIDLYEKTATIPQQKWEYSFHPSFSFNIQDTNSLYKLYIVIRHTEAYAYNNIWVDIGTKYNKDSSNHQQVNLILANNVTGWLGTGMDDVFEQRICITQAPTKLRRGLYTFTLTHVMRTNPLPHVLNIGIHVEKINM